MVIEEHNFHNYTNILGAGGKISTIFTSSAPSSFFIRDRSSSLLSVFLLLQHCSTAAPWFWFQWWYVPLDKQTYPNHGGSVVQWFKKVMFKYVWLILCMVLVSSSSKSDQNPITCLALSRPRTGLFQGILQDILWNLQRGTSSIEIRI